MPDSKNQQARKDQKDTGRKQAGSTTPSQAEGERDTVEQALENEERK